MEKMCKERQHASTFASISLTQTHDHSTHHCSNIFNESSKFFSGVYLSEKKKCGKGDFGKEIPFINSVKMIFHTFNVLWMFLIQSYVMQKMIRILTKRNVD